MKAYLGIDLGTSAVKALVLSEEGEALGIAHSELTFTTPRPGYAEQNPQDWWAGTVSAVRQVLAACPQKTEICGIGVSGQMLGSVLMDREGKADPQCIIWMDQRAEKERDFIERAVGLERILDKTSNDPLVSLWAPKLLWLRENAAQQYERIDKVLFPKDYIKYRLTGEYDIDVSDAAGTLLFNTARRVWDEELFSLLEIPREFVPESLSESTDVIGVVTKEAASELGVPQGTPVVGGGGDQMCGAVGLGVVEEGVVSSTIGTSGCLFSYSRKCVTDRQSRALLSYCHSVPDAWGIYGCTLSAGGSYQWLKNTFFQNEQVEWKKEGLDVYSFMDQCASGAAPGCEGLVFLPYLTGERTPYPDPNARGVFFGLSQRHGVPQICRSVMEGVTFSLRDTLEIFRQYGIPLSQVRAAGGGAASPLWLQIQADVFGVPVSTTNVTEAPATGAAMLAAVGTGAFGDVRQAAKRTVRVVQRVEPVARNMAIYREAYDGYRALYPVLRPLFATQAAKVARWGI